MGLSLPQRSSLEAVSSSESDSPHTPPYPPPQSNKERAPSSSAATSARSSPGHSSPIAADTSSDTTTESRREAQPGTQATGSVQTGNEAAKQASTDSDEKKGDESAKKAEEKKAADGSASAAVDKSDKSDKSSTTVVAVRKSGSATNKKSKNPEEVRMTSIRTIQRLLLCEDVASLDLTLFKVKVADFGNACWIHKHFTSDIQTRQYRAPEVIVGASYSTPVDLWSVACITFELATGDLLFEPKAGRFHEKNDDHLAQILELLERQRVPKCLSSGKLSSNYVNRKGELKAIRNLKLWGLRDVLMDKYKFSQEDASMISSFLHPLLELNPLRRATARDALGHPWLKSP